ncbi:hypothetical protein BFJ69_g7702 [Fusarium oxysporum]|uniref:Nephrocystin 3-like N-terminal domain-containing protein n=1 Tax=Fusarium oxysporum TaxID=5507 RepID=A0A420N5A6_FUSOX|nr:hypothetical protein BFJ69_g7702 [Fusarium oxysporum]
MDGLSAAASIIAVVQLTAEVTKYIIGVAGASKDRQRLLDEILACEALLMRLRDYSKGTDGPEIEDWDADQAKTHSARRGHGSGIQKVKAALKWPFDEKEVAKLVDAFQRERSLLHFAMTHESTQLVKHIKATSDDNSRQLADLVRLIKNKSTEDEHRVARLDRILTDIQLSNLNIAEGIGHLQNSQMSAHQKEVLDWISPVDYAPQQSDIFSRREPGTGEWLLESDEYNSWVKGDKQTLFCPGIPGAGKTIMASIVVNSLLDSFHSESNIGVAYIYCNFRRRHEQKASDLIANLLKQLSESQPSLFKPVEDLYNKRKASRTRPSLQELGRVLQEVAATYSRVYIVLDALDECETTDGTLPNFIQQVLDLQSATSTNILATSRYIPEIKEKFRKAVSLKIRASEPDVRRYLAGRMSQLPVFVQNKPELQEEIKTRILESVQGMFLLAQLHLDSLVGKRSPKAVRAILKALPSNSSTSKAYDKAYGDAMKRIEDQLTDQAILAKEALMWISCARRLLSPAKMLSHFKDSKISVDKVPMFQALLEHGADPNILIDETSRPLHHATSDKVEPLVQLLLDHAADVNGRDKEGRTALHLAVDSEMESLVRLLVDRGAEVNAQDDQGHTPLYHAAGRDIDPIVQLLIDHGANANLQDKHGLSVLHLAMASTFDCLVQSLIGRGESTNAHGATHKTHSTAAASNSLKPTMVKDKPQMVFEEYPLITIHELALFRSLVSSAWPSRRPPSIASMEEHLDTMQIRMEWEYEPLIGSFLSRMSEKRVLIDNLDESLYDQALDGARPFVQAMISEVKVNIRESQGNSSVYMENMHEASRTLRMYSQQLSAIELHREMVLGLLVDCARLAEMLWENNAAIKEFDRARYGELMLAARKGQDYIDRKLHESSAVGTTLDTTSSGEPMTFVIHPTSIRLRELRQRFHIDLGPEPDETSPSGSQPKLIVNLQLMEASHALVSAVP